MIGSENLDGQSSTIMGMWPFVETVKTQINSSWHCP